jgi:hypothetical protein
MDKISKVSGKSRENLTGGSRKGVPNKATKELKEMILAALDKSGGVKYLVDRANDPRTSGAFLSLVGKVLPMTVVGDKDQPLMFQVIERRIVKANA